MRIPALLFLIALPGALGAQEPRLSGRLPAPTAGEIQTLVDSAARTGLPGEPLILKALEGASKGADGPRIVVAVRGLFDRLATGRRELGAAASDQELVAAAGALRAGAAPAALRDLRAIRPGQSLVVPLGVLEDLLSEGVPMAEAWNSVRTMASQGAPDAAFLALRSRPPAAGEGPGRRNLPPTPERPPASPAGPSPGEP